MKDIHAHILPGVDDGARDLEDSVEMARMAAESGTTVIAATPHCNIPEVYDNYFGDEYWKLFERTAEELKKRNIPVQLLPGMEVFSTPDLPELLADRKIITLNGSRYLLMEFDFQEDPGFAGWILGKVAELGVVPVIAHAERYEFVQENLGLVYQWYRKGYGVQINKGSFAGRFGRAAQRAAYELLDHNLVSAVASDAHGTYARTPWMRDVWQELLEEYPADYLRVLFDENPERICRNLDLVRFRQIPFPGLQNHYQV